MVIILEGAEKDSTIRIVCGCSPDKKTEPTEDVKVIASNVKVRDPETEKYDVYIAAPFCTSKQIKSADKVRDMLNKYKYKCYMPVDAEVEFENMEEFASKVFVDRCKAIQNSGKVLACADGIDARTAFEVGYAFSQGVPIILYQEDESKDYLEEPIGIMLEQIAKVKYKSFRELDSAFFMAMSDMNR